MKLLQVADAVRYRTMTTEELREAFLISSLFQAGKLDVIYTDLDRTVIGSAVPLTNALDLPNDPALRSGFFTERRELGVLNIGNSGTVSVNGEEYRLDALDALYIGRGNEHISFRSMEATNPAAFYLLSYPSHATYAVELVRSNDLPRVTIGASESANAREITRLIHLEGVRSSQLVMGFTRLEAGSVWNTMPPHTHMRRSEVYLYFDIEESERVIHLMGLPEETRHIVVANRQVVISPGWSIHAGVGTKNYSFCWGMGGENQVYDDMDPVPVAALL